MKVGEGALGAASGLPAFVNLSSASGVRPILVTIKPAVIVDGWSVYSGSTYQAEFDEVWGHRRDVIAMRTTTEQLTRADAISHVIDTPGTYFYDPEYSSTLPAFIWDVTPLDSGYYWDQIPFLFVHLTGDADPNATVIVAQLGFYYSNEEAEHPTLGADLLGGAGDFEGAVQ